MEDTDRFSFQSVLDGMPHIYYLNSNTREDLKKYTETNLNSFNLSFTRVGDDNFSPEKFDEWKHLINDYEKIPPSLIEQVSISVLVINTLVNWLKKSNDKFMIIMFDDVDYQYIKYLDFDWNYLVNNIPYDWDSILLGFEDVLGVIPCFLHPVRDSHGTGPTLINRRYAKKLIKLHFRDGKYNFFNKVSTFHWKNKSGFVPYHYFLNQCGRSYALPIFPRNPKLKKDPYFSERLLNLNQALYSLFWKKVKYKMDTEQFFTYFSDYDVYLDKNTKTIEIRKKKLI